MEFKEVVGRRRSIRYFLPFRPVEKEKIQTILEAARLASCAVNASFLRAVVVELRRRALREEAEHRVDERIRVANAPRLREVGRARSPEFTEPAERVVRPGGAHIGVDALAAIRLGVTIEPLRPHRVLRRREHRAHVLATEGLQCKPASP